MQRQRDASLLAFLEAAIESHTHATISHTVAGLMYNSRSAASSDNACATAASATPPIQPAVPLGTPATAAVLLLLAAPTANPIAAVRRPSGISGWFSLSRGNNSSKVSPLNVETHSGSSVPACGCHPIPQRLRLLQLLRRRPRTDIHAVSERVRSEHQKRIQEVRRVGRFFFVVYPAILHGAGSCVLYLPRERLPVPRLTFPSTSPVASPSKSC